MLDEKNPLRLLAGGADYDGHMAVGISTDGGAQWSVRTVSAEASSYASALALDPANPNVIYAGGYGGATSSAGRLFKSVDGGAHWTALAPGYFGRWERRIVALSVDPSQPSRVLAGTEYDGLHRSENGGASWTRVLTANSVCRIRPAGPNAWYAATGQGVYFSGSKGASWTAAVDGMGATIVQDVDVNAAAQVVVAGVRDAGVWRKTDANRRILSITATAGGTTSPAPGVYLYAPNAAVTISAVPAAGCEFTGWTGDAAGTSNPLRVVLGADKTVTANFRHVLYPPLDFKAAKATVRSLFSARYGDRLTWAPNPANTNVAGYRLYDVTLGGRTLVGQVAAAATEYLRMDIGPDWKSVYEITVIDALGFEGGAARASIR